MPNPAEQLRSTPAETQRLLRVYNWYRLLLAALLLLMYFGRWDGRLVGGLHPQLYLATALAYLVFSTLSLMLLSRKDRPPGNAQLFVVVMVDIVVLSLLTLSSGSLETGLGALMMVAVAAGAIFFVGNIATLVAALATLAVLGTTIYLNQMAGRDAVNPVQAAILGMLFFAASWLFRSLSERIRRSYRLAEAQSQNIAKLEQINESIVQRMRTGVLVIGNQQQVRLINRAASELLGLPAGQLPARLPNELGIPLTRWQHFHDDLPRPFRIRGQGPELQARFASLQDSPGGDTLIFLEDTRRIAQQAQQLKLASLGRLTASIAHEVRNPLSAISHATQLLQESAHTDGDRRLLEIIQTHSGRINGIVENVLQLARRQAARPQRLALKPWLERFIALFAGSHPAACNLRLDMPEALDISFDPGQLEQVLGNLCENALRHSEQATGVATVILRAYHSPHGNYPILDVLNPGPVIAEDIAEQLFEPFFTTEPAGTGLGLYISRELCEFNQASLDHSPGEDGLTCFRIRFPHPDRRISLELGEPIPEETA